MHVLCILLLYAEYFLLYFLSRMTQSLKSEATKSEDMFAQFQEIQESVRLAFLNCLLDFAGIVDELLRQIFCPVVFQLEM